MIISTWLEPVRDPNTNSGVECVLCHANDDDGLNEQLSRDQYRCGELKARDFEARAVDSLSLYLGFPNQRTNQLHVEGHAIVQGKPHSGAVLYDIAQVSPRVGQGFGVSNPAKKYNRIYGFDKGDSSADIVIARSAERVTPGT
jgi:hypothetical protein